MPSRANRFQSFTPLRESTTGSLRRLKTAFSPPRSMHSRSLSTSTTPTSSSPLTRNCSPASYRSTSSTASSIRDLLAMRQRPSSALEDEMEEEKHLFETELEILEPRPSLGLFGSAPHTELHVVGIFEVLNGKC